MPVKLNWLKLAAWRREVADHARLTLQGLLEPFCLANLYPARDVIGDDGEVTERHTVMPQQQAIHDSKARFVAHVGGWGSGKTLCWAVELASQCITCPGLKVCVTAGFDYYFDEIWNPTFQEVMPPDSKHIKESLKRLVTFTNGSEIRLKAYSEPNRIRGWDAHIILVIEAAELAGGDNQKALLIVKALLGRLRAGARKVGGLSVQYPLRFLIEFNPAGHNWCWKLWIKDNPNGDLGEPVYDPNDTRPDRKPLYYRYRKVSDGGDVYECVRSGTLSNIMLAEGYTSTLIDQFRDDPQLAERFLEGAFTPLNMLVYDWPRFSERTHVIDYDAFCTRWDLDPALGVPLWWPIRVGIDTAGLASPWAVEYYCFTPDQEWVCFDEIYETGLEYRAIVDLIKTHSAGFTDIQYYIDPIASQQRGADDGKTLEMKLHDYGLTGIKKPKGYSKAGGIKTVWDFLWRDKTKPSPYIPDVFDPKTETYEIGAAKLYYIRDTCPMNLKEKGVYKYQAKTGQQGKTVDEDDLDGMLPELVEDKNDHAQTSEMFCLLSQTPRVDRVRHEQTKKPVTSGATKRRPE